MKGDMNMIKILTVAIIILIILLCIVVIIGLAKSETVEYSTFDYTSDYNTNNKREVYLTVTHRGVKDETFTIQWDKLNENTQRRLLDGCAITLKCIKTPFSEEAKVKEIWIKDRNFSEKIF